MGNGVILTWQDRKNLDVLMNAFTHIRSKTYCSPESGAGTISYLAEFAERVQDIPSLIVCGEEFDATTIMKGVAVESVVPASRLGLPWRVISKRERENIVVLAQALGKIAALAKNGQDAQGQTLTDIRVIADRLHNVPSFIRSNQACDAAALLRDGKPWPFGLPVEG